MGAPQEVGREYRGSRALAHRIDYIFMRKRQQRKADSNSHGKLGHKLDKKAAYGNDGAP